MINVNNQLFNININEFDKILLEQYKLHIELTDRISQRRYIINTSFMTLNTALLSGTYWFHDINFGILVIGILISLVWYISINSYRQLNSAKFKIIHEIEKKLSANLFNYEWQLLGREKEKMKYWSISKLEQYIPFIFIMIYLIIYLGNYFYIGRLS